jgi:hypothetical protein
MNNQEEYDNMFDFTPNFEYENIYDWLKQQPFKKPKVGVCADEVYKDYKICMLTNNLFAVDEFTFHKVIAPFSYVARTPDSRYIYKHIDIDYHMKGVSE